MGSDSQTERENCCLELELHCFVISLLAMKWNKNLLLLAWLLVVVMGAATGKYRSRAHYPRRRYVKRFRPRHRHFYEYYEPTYERIYSSRYVPDYKDDVIYRELSSSPVLALSGVGYVANSGGAIHVVG